MKEEIMQIQLQSSTSHMLVKHTARTNDQRAKFKMEEKHTFPSRYRTAASDSSRQTKLTFLIVFQYFASPADLLTTT